MFIKDLNAYQLDLFLFKDMGIGGILAKFISRMNDPVIGGYEGYFLPEPVATWYGSFYTDYMTYLDIADLDSVLAAQVASPGSQITIQFIALALEGAEEKARANEQTLNEYLENRTILLPGQLADPAESTLQICWVLCAHFQVELMGGDFNAFSYRYCKSGSQQIAAYLQDSSLAVMLRRFDEGINAKRDVNTNHPEYKFKSDIYMAYHDEHIDAYRLMRDAILDEVTDAARESSKIPRLQKALQEFDENFDVIGLINFTWDHTVTRPPSNQLSGRYTPEAKSTIIKSKYAVRYLAGQEKMCRLSGMAQTITPELLQLRQRDRDMHRVLKVALQPWPTLARLKALTDFGVWGNVHDSYFRYNHDDEEFRHKLRKTAVDRDAREGGGTIAPIVPMDKFFFEMKRPRTIADLNYGLVTGSSSSLPSTALDTLPSSSGGVVLRSRFSVMGSEAGYSETVDGDYSDFELPFGVYRQ